MLVCSKYTAPASPAARIGAPIAARPRYAVKIRSPGLSPAGEPYGPALPATGQPAGGRLLPSNCQPASRRLSAIPASDKSERTDLNDERMLATGHGLADFSGLVRKLGPCRHRLPAIRRKRAQLKVYQPERELTLPCEGRSAPGGRARTCHGRNHVRVD